MALWPAQQTKRRPGSKWKGADRRWGALAPEALPGADAAVGSTGADSPEAEAEHLGTQRNVLVVANRTAATPTLLEGGPTPRSGRIVSVCASHPGRGRPEERRLDA